MRTRFALFYSSAWLVFHVLYSIMLMSSPGITVFEAQRAAFFTILPAALAGLLVWRLCTVLGWSEAKRLRFVAIHVVTGILYSVGWAGLTVLQIAMFDPAAMDVFVQRALGWQVIMGLLIYGVICGIAYVIQMTNRLAEQRTLSARAELQALRAQLNPHFLFNTLHSITSLAGGDPGAVEGALIRFGSLLRYVLDSGKRDDEDATVEDELEFVRGYLALEKMRLGNRLNIVENIDADALDCVIPVLTLQPLVENAVNHGIAPRAEGGTIRVVARLDGDQLVIEVIDDGSGSTTEKLANATGVGLSLVKKRIFARFGASGGVVPTPTPGGGFAVRIVVPAQSMNAQRIALTADRTRSLLATPKAETVV